MNNKVIKNDEYSRLKAIIDGSNLGSWEWNTQTGEAIFNQRWAEIIGYSLEELHPVSIQTWHKFSHPDDILECSKSLNNHFDGETDFYNIETRMKHKDGHWVWVLDRGKISTWTKDGKPEWVSGTHQDITDRKELEQKLKQNEENFKNYFNENIDFLWVLDLNGKIIKVNSTVKQRLGYNEENLIGKSILKVHPENKHTETLAILKKMTQRNTLNCPVPLIKKDGTLIPVETYIFHGNWNGTPALFGTSKDISKLKFSEEKFSRLFEINSELASLSNLETGELLEVNSAFYETLGYKKEEKIDRKVFDFQQLASDFKKDDSIRNIETVIYKKDGTPVDLLMSADIIDIQDKKYNFTTAIDITKQKKAEAELLKSLHEKEMLMKEMNHRIKNNLFMISSLIDLEYSTPDKEVKLMNLKTRIEAIGLIHETLYKTENFSHVNIRDYLQHLLDKIFSSLSNNNIKIENNITSLKLPVGTIITIGLIVNETATNAVKHSFKEDMEAVFSIELLKSEPDSMFNLTISNNGRPIPKEVNLENPKTLGLQLIKNLALQLKGNFAFSKEPHPSFQITFPE